ncbi:MAG: Guanylate kinase [Pelotomaculum sp. PtaB.Bin013]|uniref:Guanylate kinase n=1 Tax=Pelotomaculum isophthalicicum JI TaxID=947010 RepID=A0A9X4JVU3_9FIRM|nr:guanylate kinase [Pelotomaculum isophthalicicum]MDF9408022.1 guanylate kinase [Pelotomaculum isophthalicicum JI]OPX90373.1 MAG: Guanylate kinase [Pelotomaculum sp. PtaB.Bin013]
MQEKGLLLVLSGPSGAGKGTISLALQKENPSLRLSVSATTRQPRKDEVDGLHYHFLKKEVFKNLINNDQLLEWAEVYGNYYGTLRRFVQESLEQGDDVMLEIDIQGALQVRQNFPDAVLIFIAPPSKSELRSRLISRDTDSKEEIEKRLGCAISEMELARQYDFIVINDDISKALEKVRAVITVEKLRPRYHELFFMQFKQ